MALRRPSTRENPHRPPVTPISDPEKIIRRGRALQRQTSRATRGATSGISRGISTVVSNRPPFQSSSTEASTSQEFMSEPENFRVEEYSSTIACENIIPRDSTEVNLPPILS